MIHLRRTAAAFLAALALAACSHNGPKKADDTSTAPPPPKQPTAPPPHTAPPPPAPATQPPPPPPAPPTPPKAAIDEMRSDANWMARHTHILEDVKKGGHEIAFVGDSITQGWEGAGKQAWDAAWAPKHAVNCGIGGDRTQHILGRFDNGLLDALAADNNHIKWVVLLIGTNNIGGGAGGDPPADVAYGVHSILGKLREKLPHAQVVLMSVFPRGQFQNPARDAINSLNATLAKMAASDPNRIHLLDINAKFLTGTGEIPKELMPDFLHLSPAGYTIWSDALADVIK